MKLTKRFWFGKGSDRIDPAEGVNFNTLEKCSKFYFVRLTRSESPRIILCKLFNEFDRLYVARYTYIISQNICTKMAAKPFNY